MSRFFSFLIPAFKKKTYTGGGKEKRTKVAQKWRCAMTAKLKNNDTSLPEKERKKKSQTHRATEEEKKIRVI